ncbi:MAG: MiaB/RimO family radical SAM methylthiotransferase [Lachnospiraceae bacterium]
MKSVALHNLGCKVNSYEMDVMQQILQEKGYTIVPFDEVADIYIINTCTVTNIADRKSRQMLHQAKARNPKAIVVAVGCYVQTGGEEVLKDAAVDLAIGNNQKKEMVSILEAFLKERENGQPEENGKEKGGRVPNAGILDINNGCDYEEMTLKHTAEHTRAYIKIQDGCNQFCSYCIIPYARGRVRSRRWEDIREEISGLAGTGYKEIVLTGIHISSYGIDFEDEAWNRGESVIRKRETGQRDYKGGSKLLDLLERIQDIEGIERIRLGSLEPRVMTAQAAERLAAMPKICPHFHLSLQSGCDETLKRMNRHYTTGEYLECVERLRKVYDHPAITTDVIVGFPGETEEEFAQTAAFLERVQFYEMHVFKYSKRKGTKAAVMPGQVPGKEQSARSSRLLALEKEQSKSFRAAYIGKEEEVLFEDAKEIGGVRYQLGHTTRYVRVAKQTGENLSNCMVTGKITGFLNDEILLMD